MKCPKCQFENREGAKFCNACGGTLEVACPQCGNLNRPSSTFCDECGHKLTLPAAPIPQPLSFEEKLEKIQRYLPGGLTEKILAQRGKIEGERKQVTVMFCDMVGFTPLSDRLTPEEVYSIADEIYEILIHKVHDYEGTVNKMTGDGIMALFGAPRAVENAPQWAIRSALAIQREIARLSNRIKGERGIPPIRMRIGIHTGPVVVGSLGNDLRVEFTAMGDTVNLASRMEGLAAPGTIYVTDETFKLTEGLFRFEALGEKQVKGKEAPVKAYRVIAPSTSRTRFDVSAERGLTPFVGRERELELLVDGFERSRAGRGQAFSIMGEAGVGKSRLLYEFRKAVSNEDVTFSEGRCLSYGRDVAYHPLIDLLKSNFDIRESDEDYQIRDKVKEGLKELGADEASTLPYLLELLGVKDSGIDKIPMTPQARKDRMMEATKRIALKGSEIRPLVMAIEDLHWIDRASEEAVKYLLESISGARVLLIFTYRPEFVPTWGSRSYHSQVTLNRLSNRESLAMLTYLLGTDEIDTELEELVLEKTEGVPFFIEEFLKSLKDLGIIEKRDGGYYLAKDIREVSIPSTIQDVIMARVDSLPDAAKGVLQTGSVIEREFSHQLIRRVTGISQDELLSHVSVLKDSELLFERGLYPHSTYIFKHALTREVVYDSILSARKKRLHVEIGDAIEEIYKDNLDEHYEALAGHYVTGDNHEKGAEYCRLAGRKGERAGSFNDAIAYAEKWVACLERLPRTEDVEKRIIDARAHLGSYYAQSGHVVEAREAVEPIVELALERDYKRRVSQIYAIIGHHAHIVEEDFPKAIKHLKEALKIAEELNDTLSLFMAHYRMAACLSENAEYDRALHHWEESLATNVAANSLWGISMMKSWISCLVHNQQGKTALAYQTSDEALRIAEESGDIYSKANAFWAHGYSCHNKGFLQEAEEHLLKAIGFTERISQYSVCADAYCILARIYFDMGQYQKSQDCAGKAPLLLEYAGHGPSPANIGRIHFARAKVMKGERDISLEPLYEYADKNRIKYFDGLLASNIGQILLNIDDQHMNEAEDWIKKAIEADTRNGTMGFLGRHCALYAELLKRKGDLPGAKEKLNTAIEILEQCGADGWVKKYQEALRKCEG